MAKTDNILREIELLERQIEAFGDYLREAELYPEPADAWGRIKRAVSLFLLRQDVARQVHQLRLRHNAALNCLRYAEKLENSREPAGTRG